MKYDEIDFQSAKTLNVAGHPHWRDGTGLAGLQKIWLLALSPAIVASIWLFGMKSARIMGLAIAFSVLLEALCNAVVKTKERTTNWHSVTLAVLFSFVMPCDAPWWLVLVGCFIMIVIGKKLFGGYGAYPVHPAILSYAMLLVSWPRRFDYTASCSLIDWPVKMIEPLRLIKTGGSAMADMYRWQDLLLGKQVGGIGNALVLYLLLGGILLLILRQVPWQIPAAFLAGHGLMAWILCLIDPDQFASPFFYLLSGSTVFAAFFLAPEHTTSPANRLPMFIYGLLGGVLLMLIRAFSVYTDGLAFTILLINLCYPLLDKITPRVLGIEAVRNA